MKRQNYFQTRNRQNRQQGYTLVELMISLTISLIALGILGRAFVSQKKTFDEQRQVVEMQQNAKIAMHLMVSEFSLAGYIVEGGTTVGGTENQPQNDTVPTQPFTADGNADNIEEMGSTSITFQGQIDDDNRTEMVRYALSGNDLTRQVWQWTQGSPDSWTTETAALPVISNVEALTITYLAESEAVTLSRTLVRKINIQMKVAAKKGDGTAFRDQTLSSGSLARNLGL